MRKVIVQSVAACLPLVSAGILDDLSAMSFGNGAAASGGAAPAGVATPQIPQQQMGGAQPSGNVQVAVDAAGNPIAVQEEPFDEMDLSCLRNQDAQTWFNIQQKLRYVLPPEAAFGQVGGKELLEPALMSVVDDMNSLSAPMADVCGVGKLAAQLLSIIAADDNGGSVAPALKNEQMTSPMMTLMLDIPWANYQPQWPFFGLYAQMAMRRMKQHQNSLEQDGLTSQEMMNYAAAMNVGIQEGNLDNLKELATLFLETGTAGVQESPLAFITAIFTQAATTDNKTEAKEMFLVAQSIMKRLLHGPEDFDSTLSTRWPLWGMAYLASLNQA